MRTSERIVEEYSRSTINDYIIYLFHMAAYRYCFPYVEGKKVLEFGSGSGYGTAFLADKCEQIVGIDISQSAVDYARSKYQRTNLVFMQNNCIEENNLPFEDNAFDVVISFQVIEHIKDIDSYLGEICRVLKSDGYFIVSTPSRDYRLFPFQKPWNVHHIKEYSYDSLLGVLETRFSQNKMLKVSASKKMTKYELLRITKIKWLTLPFTLPITPEWLRLSVLRFISNFKCNFRSNKPDLISGAEGKFDENDISISESADTCFHLLAVCRK